MLVVSLSLFALTSLVSADEEPAQESTEPSLIAPSEQPSSAIDPPPPSEQPPVDLTEPPPIFIDPPAAEREPDALQNNQP